MIANFQRTKYATDIQYLLIMLSKRKTERSKRERDREREARKDNQRRKGGGEETWRERGASGTLDVSQFSAQPLYSSPLPTSMGPEAPTQPTG